MMPRKKKPLLTPEERSAINRANAQKRFEGKEVARKRQYVKPTGTPEERAEKQRQGRIKGGKRSTYLQVVERKYLSPEERTKRHDAWRKSPKGQEAVEIVEGLFPSPEEAEEMKRQNAKRDRKCSCCFSPTPCALPFGPIDPELSEEELEERRMFLWQALRSFG